MLSGNPDDLDTQTRREKPFYSGVLKSEAEGPAGVTLVPTGWHLFRVSAALPGSVNL